jgi:CubicO group peptidase (beta-lactamase class C family)
MHRDTLFDLASLTKVVATTSLLLGAHHEGVCHLDEDLQYFYPQLKHRPMGTVTLRQLLAHTGGLKAWHPLYQLLWPMTPAQHAAAASYERRHQATQAILHMPLAYTPGTQSVYSDLGFILLGHLLETLYAQPLSTLFLAKVAQPLGLRTMAYRPLDSISPLPDTPTAYAATEACPWRGRVLAGEVHDENAWAMGGLAGHAGLFATAKDVWHFAQIQLDTVAGKNDWLPPSLVKASWQRHPAPPGSTRALGWDTPTSMASTAGHFFSPRSVGHLGFTGTSMWLDPEYGVTVILCTNRIHPTRLRTGIQRLRPAVHNLVMRALGVAV